MELNKVTSAASATTTAGVFVLICGFPVKVRSVRLQQFVTTVNLVEIGIRLKIY
jgi:intracellular sulfur oxidation DsrE/DsrF family protein